ncbi:MAG: stage III sporulation protein AC [Lachnospiraceae bacterium]|nr:stage III sporulation protein AC [Lachnospiraceae bacterium]
MEGNILLKIAAVGIVISLLAQVLKHSGRDELAFMTQLLGLLIVIGWVLPYIRKLLTEFSRLLTF